MSWQLRILGSSSAMPTRDRFPSCQLLILPELSILLDCGEGAQIQMRRYDVRWMRIRYIFISHLHGDHIFGLPGVLTSYHLMGRRTPLVIYGPIGIKQYLHASLQSMGHSLCYAWHVHEHAASSPEDLLTEQSFSVQTIPLQHRVPTTGYLITEVVTPQ